MPVADRSGRERPDGCRSRLVIVSGGQSGVDRAALDWALESGFAHDGWCPAGGLAEDGLIPARHRLRQTPSPDPAQRTEWNVRDSDATLILARSLPLTGGTALTARLARRLGKPLLVITEADPAGTAAARHRLREFVVGHRVTRLNVAGPRESQAPGLSGFVRAVLDGLAETHPTR